MSIAVTDLTFNASQQSTGTHASHTDHCDVVGRLALGDVQDCTAPGEHGATKERGDLRRDIIGHRRHRALGHHSVGGEDRNAHMVLDLVTGSISKPAASVKQCAVFVGSVAVGAGDHPFGSAPGTIAAPGQKSDDRPLDNPKLLASRSDLLDDAGGFVTQQRRDRSWPVTVKTERSEWQTLAAFTRMSSSSSPDSDNRMSSRTCSGTLSR